MMVEYSGLLYFTPPLTKLQSDVQCVQKYTCISNKSLINIVMKAHFKGMDSKVWRVTLIYLHLDVFKQFCSITSTCPKVD